MVFHSSTRTQTVNRRAVAWALLSQSIWLPALISVSHDSLLSSKNDYKTIANSHASSNSSFDVSHENLLPKSNSQAALLAIRPPHSSGIFLNSLPPYQKTYHRQSFESESTSSQAPLAFSPPPIRSSSSVSLLTKIEHIPRSSLPASTSPDIFRHLYNQSDLLGGEITLRDIHEPLIPPLARAEMAKYLRSGDPLSPIPGYWREPMRQALKSLTKQNSPSLPIHQSNSSEIDQARVVHVPSTRLKRSADVPLALQSDGSVDILNVPSDPAVVDEIKIWSTKQTLPTKGRMVPAVVHLHPLTEADQNLSSDHADQRTSSGLLQSKKSKKTDPPTSTAYQASSIPLTQSTPPTSNTPPHQVDPVEPSPTPPAPISKMTSEVPVSEATPIQSSGEVQ